MQASDIFLDNERSANRYAAMCLRVAAAVTALMWGLNLLGFFIVDKQLMNVAMPVGIVLFLLPSALVKTWRRRQRMLKYAIMGCFLLGICLMSSALTIQLVLAWACPLLLSCHYYSPRVTHFTLAGALICMFASVYIGLYFGVWDSNMMRSSDVLTGFAARADYILAARASGDDILVRVFNFYYIPRAVILVVVYLIGLTLSRRTHALLRRQEKDSRERERISTELNVAKHIQASMLPCIFPAFPGRPEFDVYASMTPAKEVGGDFYDFFLVDEDHLALVMADVSGKGVPAALFMVIAKTLLKNAAQNCLSPAKVLEQVNRQLCESNDAQMFVTVWLGIYQISTGQLVAANAGHEYPALRRSGGDFALVKNRHGLVLAAMDTITYREYELTLAPGDALFVYTDGVPEAVDADNVQFGTQRMLDALNRDPALNLPDMLRLLSEEINRFAGSTPQFDDITMLCLQRKR